MNSRDMSEKLLSITADIKELQPSLHKAAIIRKERAIKWIAVRCRTVNRGGSLLSSSAECLTRTRRTGGGEMAPDCEASALLPCCPATLPGPRPKISPRRSASGRSGGRGRGQAPKSFYERPPFFTPLWKQAAPGAGSGGLSMTRASSAACGLPWLQDKNLLIPVTPPSDGGFGMGYTRAGTAVTIATRAKTSTGAYVCL